MRKPAGSSERPSSGGPLLLVIALILVVVIAANIHASRRPDPRATEGSEELRRDACYMARQFVEQRLKAPSTADFENCYDVSVSYAPPATYFVSSYVDSQNGFGAMIRTDYRATVWHVAGDEWRLVDLTFD